MDIVGLIVILAAVGVIAYFLGTAQGEATERAFVARTAAEYRTVVADADTAVKGLIAKLGTEYRERYTSAVNEVDKLEADLKKAL